MVDNYLALLKRAQTEPEAVAADVRSGRLSDYQVPVYITNIHPNDCPAVTSDRVPEGRGHPGASSPILNGRQRDLHL